MLTRDSKNEVGDVLLLGELVPLMPAQGDLVQNVEDFFVLECHFSFRPVQDFVLQGDQEGFVADLHRWKDTVVMLFIFFLFAGSCSSSVLMEVQTRQWCHWCFLCYSYQLIHLMIMAVSCLDSMILASFSV